MHQINISINQPTDNEKLSTSVDQLTKMPQISINQWFDEEAIN